MAASGGKQSVLVSWVGQRDLDASDGKEGTGEGALGRIVGAGSFDRVELLSDYPAGRSKAFLEWLAGRTQAQVRLKPVKLTSPTNYTEIYEAVTERLRSIEEQYGPDLERTFNLSSGTPAMTAVWVILAKTYYPATMLQSSPEKGVEVAQIPFNLAAEFIPRIYARPDENLARLSAGEAGPVPGFEAIAHQSEEMGEVLAQARLVAPRSVSVLVEGESGTGKELLARAIHARSPRADGPFIAVNCGAIVQELAESEFFGHKKGTFTGTTGDRAGHFEQANGGTLFLDEVGEMPSSIQVKLLRALQERAITRVGESDSIKVDVRVIAATNRHLAVEVGEGRFREDLFYRLAVAVLRLPPLRERRGDIGLLIDRLLAQVNDENKADPDWKEKKLSVSARNLLLRQPWPGNIRELQNTLLRSAVWTPGDTISEAAARSALLVVPRGGRGSDGILNRPISQGIDLRAVLSEVTRHYLRRALDEASGNVTRVAELTGLKNPQTVKSWMKNHGVER